MSGNRYIVLGIPIVGGRRNPLLFLLVICTIVTCGFAWAADTSTIVISDSDLTEDCSNYYFGDIELAIPSRLKPKISRFSTYLPVSEGEYASISDHMFFDREKGDEEFQDACDARLSDAKFDSNDNTVLFTDERLDSITGLPSYQLATVDIISHASPRVYYVKLTILLKLPTGYLEFYSSERYNTSGLDVQLEANMAKVQQQKKMLECLELFRSRYKMVGRQCVSVPSNHFRTKFGLIDVDGLNRRPVFKVMVSVNSLPGVHIYTGNHYDYIDPQRSVLHHAFFLNQSMDSNPILNLRKVAGRIGLELLLFDVNNRETEMFWMDLTCPESPAHVPLKFFSWHRLSGDEVQNEKKHQEMMEQWSLILSSVKQ